MVARIKAGRSRCRHRWHCFGPSKSVQCTDCNEDGNEQSESTALRLPVAHVDIAMGERRVWQGAYSGEYLRVGGGWGKSTERLEVCDDAVGAYQNEELLRFGRNFLLSLLGGSSVIESTSYELFAEAVKS